MPAAISISLDAVPPLLRTVFEHPGVTVYTSDSEFGEATTTFRSLDELTAHFQARIEAEKNFVAYAVHYSEMRGYIQDRRVSLDPQKCHGHTFRYSVGGWGLIHIQLRLKRAGEVSCSISVNSQKRAIAWFATYPELKDPDLWNWKAVEKHARRLSRRVSALAQQTIPADRAKARAG
jgi:hypothetical protein